MVAKKPRIVRYPKQQLDPDAVDLDNANTTELVQIARAQGIKDACRGVPREVLIESLYALQPLPVEDPLLQTRIDLSLWMRKYWGKLSSQASQLPPELMKPEDILNSDLVADAEVLDLWLENKDQMRSW